MPRYLILTLLFLASVSGHRIVAREHNAVRQIPVTLRHQAMGVEFRITYHALPQTDVKALNQAIEKRIDRLEQVFSDYRPDSETNRFCDTAPHPEFQTVDSDLYYLVNAAQSISEQTEGAFDITVGALSQVWRMARKRNRLPQERSIEKARILTGYQNLEVGPPSQLRLTKEGVRLDFGGIAKGYAADQIIEILQEHQIITALVDAGGDIRGISGPDHNGWRIGIRGMPGNDLSDPETLPQLVLKNAAIATSGDLHQHLDSGGKRHSHVIDPRTGEATTSVVFVTIIAKSGEMADAMASALQVMNADAGIALAEQNANLQARVVRRVVPSGKSVEVLRTRDFPRIQFAPAGQTR